MKKIIISPWSRKLNNGNRNPKNYPYWAKVVKLLKEMEDVEIVQIGLEGEELIGADMVLFNRTYKEIKVRIKQCDVWASVDNFCQHLGSLVGKRGVAIFSKSDPNIYGYEQNINLLKNRRYLMPNQFCTWEETDYDENAFVPPSEVVNAILSLIN